MARKFSVNGFYFDFASIELGLVGVTRLPNELMSVTFGDGITRPDIEGTGQVPLGAGRGRYKCDNLVVKSTLESYLELLDSDDLNVKGYGNVIFEVTLSLQQEGAPEFNLRFPECSLVKQPFSFQQADASLGLTWELKSRYLTINGNCLGDLGQ